MQRHLALPHPLPLPLPQPLPMKNYRTLIPAALASVAVTCLAAVALAADDYYPDERVFVSRPKIEQSVPVGHIGPTGIIAHINPGDLLTVEGTQEGSPAEGRFVKGEVIVGVNGNTLKGTNTFVVLGQAITRAEAGDGKLVFDVKSGKKAAGPLRQVAVKIPALGAYGGTWPVDCGKSQKIVEQAENYYHQAVDAGADRGISGALQCLFLLSTGDDKHLPVVKKHYQKFIDTPKSIGDHTWNNGYNGIACAEYYLRTGDKDMLPVLQAFCDDARDRQKFGCGWIHWGPSVNPQYVASGLMNPAGAQVLTTLLLCKEAGVNVDEKTLLGSLKFFWRFAGRGTVPYGDHRGEGGLGSNGKDGMIAAAMQVASGASGNTAIYQSARDCLSMSMLASYPNMVTGHGDNGRGDGIWRGISTAYLKDKKPADYRAMMDGIAWWFDLSRFHSGAMGMAMCKRFNDTGSGAAVALAYTTPLKTLRITGAPRSKYAVDFALPEHLWGNKADLAFHSVDHHPDYFKHGKPMAMHQILNTFGSAYSKGTIETDPDRVPAELALKHVYHHNYMVRAQAAKALRIKGGIAELERLLADPDPRIRRAALDGIIDWRYWFSRGKNTLKAGDFTPGMISAIAGMLRDPEESVYVVEGALFAMSLMPPARIHESLTAIMAWTTHDDWWLRDASFTALQGLEAEERYYRDVAPKLVDMMVAEYHTMPRQHMNAVLARALKKYGPPSAIGRILATGFEKAVVESAVKAMPRSPEGAYNILGSVMESVKVAPEVAPDMAELLHKRNLSLIKTDLLIGLMNGSRGFEGFLATLGKLDSPGRKKLENTLYQNYRPELVKRLKESKGTDIKLIGAILALTKLREDIDGWQKVGTPAPAERTWQFTSFQPTLEKDIKPLREGRRMREVTLPASFDGWYKPDFQAKGWQSGKTPIGKGVYGRGSQVLENRSPWGDGEFLLARTTFNHDGSKHDLYRISILANQGYHVYLNGVRIGSYSWWNNNPTYAHKILSDKAAKLLKKGQNTLAVYTVCAYPSAAKPHLKEKVVGQMDCYIEGLRVKDLY